VLGSNRLDLRSVQGSSLSHGRVSLDVDSSSNGSFSELLVLEEGVRFDLVDGRLDSAVLQQVVELFDVKVGDTNVLDETLVDTVFEVLPSLDSSFLAHVTRRVDEVHVHVGQLELLQRVLNGIQGSLVVGIPELRGDEDVLSLDTRLLSPRSNGSSDGLFVGVSGSTIDVTVTGVKGPFDGLLGSVVVGGLVDTESDLEKSGNAE